MHKAGRGLSMKCESAKNRASIYPRNSGLAWLRIPREDAAGSCLSDLVRNGIASSNAFRDGDSLNSLDELAKPQRRFRCAATPRRLSTNWRVLIAIYPQLDAITARWEETVSSHASRTSRPRSALCHGTRFAALPSKRLGKFTPRTPSTTRRTGDSLVRARNA